jgi:hypothetical protein
MLMYRLSLAGTVLASFCTGLFLDLVFLTPRFGFLGLSLALASFFLYDVKNYFFPHRSVTIFLMTFLLTEFYTAIQYLIAASCSFQVMHGAFVLDFLIMPGIDSAAAWLLFYAVPICFHLCKESLWPRKCVS